MQYKDWEILNVGLGEGPAALGIDPKGEAIIEGYYTQDSFEDKFLYNVNAHAYSKTMLDAELEKRAEEAGMSVDDYKSSPDTKGVRDTEVFTKSEISAMDRIDELLFGEMIGDGSYRTIEENLRKAVNFNVNIMFKYGQEYQEVLDQLPPDEPNRENKAAYIVHNLGGINEEYQAAVDNLTGFAGINQYLSDDEASKEKIWKALNYNDDMTIDQYLNGLGYTDKEKKDFYEDYKAYHPKPDGNLFKLVRAEQKATNRSIRSSEVRNLIKKSFLDRFGQHIADMSLTFKLDAFDKAKKMLPPKEQKLLDAGSFILTGNKNVPAPTPEDPDKTVELGIGKGSLDPKEKEEFKKWKETKGKDLIEKLKKGRMEKTREHIKKVLNTTEKLNASSDKIIGSFYMVDKLFLRGAIGDLRSTKEAAGSHEDSPQYTAMLKNLIQYEYSVSSNDVPKAVEDRGKLIKSCLDYIADKKGRVRHNIWGQKRFDDTLMILSEVMPKSDFRKLIESINKARGTKPGKSDYIDYENTYSNVAKYKEGSDFKRIRDDCIASEKVLQEDTKKNSTRITSEYKDRIERLDSIFGPVPGQVDEMIGFFGRGGENGRYEMLPDYKEKFDPIGFALEGAELSAKDFAAVAYAATLTPEAAEIDKNYPMLKSGKKLLLEGEKYTNYLADDRYKEARGLQNVVQYGREAARDALKEYAKGNKEPLAKIITSSIKHMCLKSKCATKVDDTFIYHAEMGSRMMKMMNRDPELLKYAINNGLSQDVYKEMKHIKNMSSLMTKDISNRQKLSNTDFIGAASEEQMLEVYTDILLKKVVNRSINNAINKAEANPACLQEIEQIRKDSRIKANEAAKQGGENVITNSMQALHLGNVNVSLARLKYLPENKLINSFNDPEKYKQLRKEVKNFAKKEGLHKLRVKDFEGKLSNTQFNKKLDTITKKYEPVQKKAAPAKKVPVKGKAAGRK